MIWYICNKEFIKFIGTGEYLRIKRDLDALREASFLYCPFCIVLFVLSNFICQACKNLLGYI